MKLETGGNAMKTFSEWKEEHNVHQGYPDHEAIYNGGYLEGLRMGSDSISAKDGQFEGMSASCRLAERQLAAMTAAKNKALEALKESLDEYYELAVNNETSCEKMSTADSSWNRLHTVLAELEDVSGKHIPAQLNPDKRILE